MQLSEIPVLAITGFATIALGLVVLVFGFLQARKRRTLNHKKIMILSVIVLGAFLAQYLVRVLAFHQETLFTGPDSIKYAIYYPVLAVHITFAIITIVLVIFQLTRSLKSQNRTENAIVFPKEYRPKHRKSGRIIFLLWFFSYLGGITIFIMLYILTY